MNHIQHSDNLLQSKQLFPITSEILVPCNQRISGFDWFGAYSISAMMYFPYVVIDKEGKYCGVASKADIQGYTLTHSNTYKSATFGDVANRNAEVYPINELPQETNHRFTVVINDYDEPVMFYLSADRFISSVFIDIVDACNLSCPNCYRGLRELPNTPEKMSLDSFEYIIKTLSEQYGIKSFNLYNYSEPFLADDLHKYFNILDKYGCKGYLSSNLSIKNNDVLERVITHNRLDSIMISVSGFTTAVHGIYHRGSDINVVKSNLEFISKLKLSRSPESFIFVKFLKFGYNESEILKFKEYVENLGLTFGVFSGWGDLESFKHPLAPKTLADRIRDSLSAKPVNINYCCSMFNQIVINAKCDIFVCCDEPAIESLKIGNFYSDTIEDIFAKKFFYPGCRNCRIPKIVPMNNNVGRIIADAISASKQETR